ncbi:MAG: S1/P1 nuclease [Gemmatimonadetes bacterium]|nr:S1/P1 nuclease [Gemmatimonadota bacterium]MYD26412.1 S1/P1 nuclease [Gemmatimonadota bacterium]MYI98416.1 S1/P1 nuclease [Gemmatimonadota bacterium]
MRTARIAIASILLLCGSLPAAAWGPNGHRIVGRIAENHLTDAAREGISELIGRASLAQVSTWADEIKSDPAWRHASPWHYVNAPPGQSIEKAHKSPSGDVIEAILRFERVLRDRGAGKKERVDALRFLVHFVGDIHQPLHAGYASDRGGNDVRVRWFGENTNLHTVWDEHLVEYQRLSFTEWVRFFGHAEPGEIEAWRRSTVWDWARESRSMLPAVYDHGDSRSTSTPYLGYDYIFRHNDGVKKRLLQAGIRLSGMLNDVFSSP